MFDHIDISHFRAIKNLGLSELKQVNLLVGTNNSGKTSVLEAIELLATEGRYETLSQALYRRNEILPQGRGFNVRPSNFSMFHGYGPGPGSQATLTGRRSHQSALGVVVSIQDTQWPFQGSQPSLFDAAERQDKGLFDGTRRPDGEPRWDLVVQVRRGQSDPQETRHPLVPSSFKGRVPFPKEDDEGATLVFVTTSALSSHQIVRMFEKVVLTEVESLMLDALRIIEPGVVRLASIGSDNLRYDPGYRGGIVVNIKGLPPRLPISSMGEGIWRLLGLALALAHARGGVLLIDEIDTGLHYSVMEAMWKLIIETARRLNIQVFATTHSSDCWLSLAHVLEAQSVAQDKPSVSIQRIERGRDRTVAFCEEEIVLAAARHLEVR